MSPFEHLYGTPPSYSSLRVFGYACFVLLQPHEHSKLEPQSRLCCFLGYGIEHKSYRCWDPISQRFRISACCNHLSPDSQLFSFVIPTTHAPLIQTAYG